MAGQSDADDLIAELAKLMAQDSGSAQPAKPAAPTFTVRIPGEQTAAVAQPAAPQPVAPAAAQPSAPVRPPSDPLAAAKPAEPIRQPAPPPQAPVAQPKAALEPEEHDSIAELIAAELAVEAMQAAVAPPPPVVALVQPQPAVEAVARETSNNTPSTDMVPSQDEPQRPSQPATPPQSASPEQDRFKIAPVFGLGAAPAARPAAPATAPTVSPPPIERSVQPAARPANVEPAFTPVRQPVAPVAQPAATQSMPVDDPIDEIESLIGRAMRVELDAPTEKPARVEPAVVDPRPALRSLATPVARGSQASSSAMSGADEAILAAAQATGAQVGWVEAPATAAAPPKSKRFQRQPRERVERSARAPGSGGVSRAVAGPLVAVTLLLAAGFGLYWVLGQGGQSGTPPLLTADAAPIKETPPAPTASDTPQQSVVFNEIDGVVPGAEEQLVSRDQADVNEVTQVAATPDISQEGLANRRVRTMTVRPDGTIVRSENSVAGSSILPVDRPVVPEIAGTEPASQELLASVEPEPVVPAAVVPEPTAPPVAIVTPGSTVPAVDSDGNELPGRTSVIPLQRPTNLPQVAAALPQPTSPVNALLPTDAPAATTTPATPTATAPVGQPSSTIPGATEVEALSNDAPAYVQLASQRTEGEARSTAQALVSRFGPLFGGANMEVQRVDLGTRGIFYRVRVPASSVSDANTICTNVKAAGGDCITM